MSFLQQLNVATPKKNELTPEIFTQLRDHIYAKTGIFFPENKKYLLESRIGRRLTALSLKDYAAYYQHIRGRAGEIELKDLINAITINETFFFRNEAQFDVIENELLPQIIKARQADGSRRVRIWSAASSTGDEPYTLALIIRERLQPRYPGIKFEIVGTDINTKVLDVAKNGIYREYAVRNIPLNYQKYFVREGDKYSLKPEIRKIVQFKRLNLSDRPGMSAMRSFDLIMCANVLIYFDAEAKKRVIASLYNSLNPGGYLFVGFSESLYGLTQSFKPVHFAKTIAYNKE